jgi:hypothetical protein
MGGSSSGGTLSTTGGTAMAGKGGAAAGSPNAKGGAAGNGGAGGTTAGASGSGGTSKGGATDGGTSGGSGGSGGAAPTECTREMLKNAVDAYFKALAAHDPSTLPLADNVKFTENAKTMKLGEGGLWKTAGALVYAHTAFDTKACSTASEAVVPDGSTDIPVALRLKLVSGKMTEIETIAVRAGDYKVGGGTFASNTAALAASKSNCKWLDPVPMEQQNTYEELTNWIVKYFKMFPRGVCNTTSDCKRIENGGGSFNCTLGASCAAGEPSASDNALPVRLVLADPEMGIGVGFTIFGGIDTDMHMYKMVDGNILCVSAILGDPDDSGKSGWE